jgi:saccharopine dehydrogenase-like NADP-dependent oxidoreductase
MKTILLLGAGKSSNVLLDYLETNASNYDWQISVGDIDLDSLKSKIADKPHFKGFLLNLDDSENTKSYIQKADIVISMLPAILHISIAKYCVEFSKNLITPSYISDEMMALSEEVKFKGLIFMNELGLDPGIDHMSAMEIFDRLRAEGAEIKSFKSYCGGLVAKECDDNPWNYKFSWNPRNVILAGQGKGGIKYQENNHLKYIPYYNLFKRVEPVVMSGIGTYEGYPNRDSLKYKLVYGLNQIETMLRGTIREKGYCKGWDIVVEMGLTDDTYIVENVKGKTYNDFFEMFMPRDTLNMMGGMTDNLLEKFFFLGFDDHESLIEKDGSPAAILQSIMEKKMGLKPGDRDLILMQHQIEYTKENKRYKIISDLVLEGKDETDTAMASTVGLPIGIMCKMILEGIFKTPGVQYPIAKEVYEPMLEELVGFGVVFKEQVEVVK